MKDITILLDRDQSHCVSSRPKELEWRLAVSSWSKQSQPGKPAQSSTEKKKGESVTITNLFFLLKKEILSVKMFSPLPHDHIYRDLLIRRLHPNHTCKKLLPYKLQLFIQSSTLQLLAEMRIQLTWCHLLVQWLLLQLQMSSHTGLVQRLPLSRFAWMYLCP